jgi:hypothetical protein
MSIETNFSSFVDVNLDEVRRKLNEIMSEYLTRFHIPLKQTETDITRIENTSKGVLGFNIDEIKRGIDNLGNTIMGGLNQAKEFIINKFNEAKDVVIGGINFIKDQITGALTQLGNLLNTALLAVANAFDLVGKTLSDGFGSLVKAIGEVFTVKPEDILEGFMTAQKLIEAKKAEVERGGR